MNKETIPEHTTCINCGACCGPVIIDVDEFEAIQSFVNENKPDYNAKHKLFDCKFRVRKRCSIHEVKPVLCRLMGVAKGIKCNFGNSNNIDGFKFINRDIERKGFLNYVVKTDY